MFVLGDFSFQLDAFSIKFENKKISPFGVSGLPWAPLEPMQHFGKSVFVTVSISKPAPFNFVVPAQIIREYTPAASTMGLQFHLEESQLAAFTEFTNQHGTPPVAYTRKFPRIPSIHLIQTYPLKVITTIRGQKMEFEVENISPEGIMIFSENEAVFDLKIKEEISLTIDPGLNEPYPVQTQGSIRRILDDFNLGRRNAVRHVGIQFSSLPENEKKNLMTLLRDILLQIKGKDQTEK